MQQSKIITLDEANGVTVTVREFKVKAIKELVANAQGIENLPVMDLLTSKFAQLSTFLKPYVETDIPFDELTFSEIETIVDGLKEVNQSFFKMGDQLTAYLGQSLVKVIEPALKKILSEMPDASGAISTSPASSL